MMNIKRAVGLALIILISTSAAMPVQAFGQKKWTIGYEENTNGPEKKVQGTNGWYFMYSEEVNAGGEFNASTAKECVWADKGSCWMWYDYDAMWVPDIYAADGYDCLASNCWWRMDGNGIMDPNVTEGAVRSVIAWAAPEDGTYSINIDYTAGSMPFNLYGKKYDEGDGLTLCLSTDTNTVEKVFCGVGPDTGRKVIENIPTGNLSKTLTLKKGEKIYISADPGENGGSDIATIKAEIIQEEGESVRSYLLTILAAGIAVIAFLLILSIVLFLRRKKIDWEYEEYEEEEE